MFVQLKDEKELLEEISSLGEELNEKVYLVGGPARDKILNLPLKDIDIMVLGDGIRFAKEFAKRKKKRIKIFYEFLTAKIDDLKIDFSTARKEFYPEYGSLPVVSKGSFEEDARRRDFTINAIYISLNKENFCEVIDIVGGLNDLKNGLLRILHNDSFKDDATRILRGIRFIGRFGFRFDKDTEIKLNEDKVYLQNITFERILRELLLLCEEEGKGFKWLKYYGIDDILNIKIPDERDKEEILNFSRKHNIRPEKSLLLYLFFNDERLKIKEYRRNLNFIKNFPENRFDINRILKIEKDFLPLIYVKFPFKEEIEKFIKLKNEIKTELNGEEIKSFGFPEKDCGRIKKEIIEERWKGNIKNKKDEIDYLKRRLYEHRRNEK
uniref:CCA tRNA nucleotidyltransferase n=1 Tax=candidate division WOR-3 bacterium TaxID=2052148 RepID=A0A7C4U7B3_UNCW3